MDWGQINDSGSDDGGDAIWASVAPVKSKKRRGTGSSGMKPSKRDKVKKVPGTKKGIRRSSIKSGSNHRSDDDDSSSLMYGGAGGDGDGGDSTSLMADDASSTAWEMGSLFEGQDENASTNFEPVVFSDWGDFGMMSNSNMSVASSQDKGVPLELSVRKKQDRRLKKQRSKSHVSLASAESDESQLHQWGEAAPLTDLPIKQQQQQQQQQQQPQQQQPQQQPPQDLSFRANQQQPQQPQTLWSQHQPEEPPSELRASSKSELEQKKKKKKKDKSKKKRSKGEKNLDTNDSSRSKSTSYSESYLEGNTANYSSQSKSSSQYPKSPGSTALTDTSSPDTLYGSPSYVAPPGTTLRSIYDDDTTTNFSSALSTGHRSSARSTGHRSSARSTARSTVTAYSTAATATTVSSGLSRDDYIQQLILLQTQQAAVTTTRDGSFHEEYASSRLSANNSSFNKGGDNKSVDTTNSKGTQLSRDTMTSRDTKITQSSNNPAIHGRPAIMFQDSQRNDSYIQSLMTGDPVSAKAASEVIKKQDPLEDRNIMIPVGRQKPTKVDANQAVAEAKYGGRQQEQQHIPNYGGRQQQNPQHYGHKQSFEMQTSSTATHATLDDDRLEVYLPKSALKNRGEGLPITMDTPEKPKKDCLTCKKKSIIAAILFAIILAITLGAVMSSVKAPTEQDVDEQNDLQTTTTEDHSQFYMDMFAPISGTDALADSSSPQHQAAMWMLEAYGPQEVTNELMDKLTPQYALAVLFYALTFGDESASLDGWLNADLHECDWSPGIECNFDGGEVIAIDLGGRGLEGFIPEELQYMTALQSVILSNNTLVGTIPPLGNLVKLEHFEIEHSELTGSIPANMEGLMKLTTLRLSHNAMSGSLPTYFASNLQYIGLSDNNFEGLIPPSLFDGLQGLQHLDISSNRGLTGILPSELTTAATLEHLDISDCSLTGTLPIEVSSKGSKLEVLLLNDNQINGSLPTLLGALSNLIVLDLSSNQLIGSLPQEMAELSNLRFLGVRTNNLTGEIPSSFRNLRNLDSAVLYDNALAGSWPLCSNDDPFDEVSNSNYTLDCDVICICCIDCV